MGIFDSLFGSKEKSYGESGARGTTTQTNVEDINTVFERISDTLDSLRSTGTLRRGSEVTRAQLENVIRQLPKTIGRYSREQAIEDSSGAVQAIIQDILNSELGGILQLQTMSGATNDSSTRIATEGLTAKAAAEGAKLRLGAISDYAEKQLQGMSVLQGLLQLGAETDVVSTEEQEGTTTAKDTGTEQQSALKQANQQFEQSGYQKGTTRGRGGILNEITNLFAPDDK